MSKISNIQALRFFSALFVACFHVSAHYKLAGGENLFSVFKYGWAGVDVFFVISGFVIHQAYTKVKNLNDACYFLHCRLMRIFSGYWPWLALTYLCFWYFRPEVLVDKNLLDSIFLIYQPNQNNLLAVSWTLTYEIFFYFIFFVLCLFSKKTLLPILLFFVSLITISYLAHGAHGLLLSPLLLELIAGSILSVLNTKIINKKMALIVLATLSFVMIYTLTIPQHDPMMRSLTTGVLAIFIVYLALSLDHYGYKANKTLSMFGDASYSLYLCHIPIIWTAQWSITNLISSNPDIYFPLLVIFIIFISIAWYKLYEIPTYTFLKKLFPAKLIK